MKRLFCVVLVLNILHQSLAYSQSSVSVDIKYETPSISNLSEAFANFGNKIKTTNGAEAALDTYKSSALQIVAITLAYIGPRVWKEGWYNNYEAITKAIVSSAERKLESEMGLKNRLGNMIADTVINAAIDAISEYAEQSVSGKIEIGGIKINASDAAKELTWLAMKEAYAWSKGPTTDNLVDQFGILYDVSKKNYKAWWDAYNAYRGLGVSTASNVVYSIYARYAVKYLKEENSIQRKNIINEMKSQLTSALKQYNDACQAAWVDRGQCGMADYVNTMAGDLEISLIRAGIEKFGTTIPVPPPTCITASCTNDPLKDNLTTQTQPTKIDHFGAIAGVDGVNRYSDDRGFFLPQRVTPTDGKTPAYTNGETINIETFANDGVTKIQVGTGRVTVDAGYIYSAWGEWNGTLTGTDSNTGASTRINRGYFVVGVPTTPSEFNGLKGTATYSGSLKGDYFSPQTGAVSPGAITGSAFLSADFDQKTMNGRFNMFLNNSLWANGTLNQTALDTFGGNLKGFQTTFVPERDNQGNVVSQGGAWGGLYGPKAQEAGGAFYYSRYGDGVAEGIWRAKKQ